MKAKTSILFLAITTLLTTLAMHSAQPSNTLEQVQATIAGVNSPAQVARDNNNNAIAVWSNETDGSIYSARYDAAIATWGIPQVISGGTAENNQPQITMDNNGNAIAIWNNDAHNLIFSSRYNATTGTWNAPQDISFGAQGESNNPQIAMDNHNNAIAVWNNEDDGQIYSARYNAIIAEWGVPEVISFEGTNSRPRITMNNNNAVVTWQNTDDGRYYSARYDSNTATWGAPEISQREAG